MKVIHLIGGGDEGGAKSHVLQLVKELGKHIDVTLVSFRRGKFHEDAVDMGIDARAIHSGNVILDLNRTLKLIKEGGYDVIHSHGAKANMMASIIKRMTGIPVVTTVHSDYRLDYMHSVLKRFSFGVINMIALRRIDYHISVSNNFKEMLIDRGFNPQRIYSVYNGIPFDNDIPPYTRREFFERFKVPFPEDCVLIGIMARLHPVKDHETFLKAAAEVVKKNPKARFLISGPGDELRAPLSQLAEKLGIASYVYFTGMVDRPFDFFQSIDINVLTSISESFPYVILEGTRFARATVSTRVGGLGDLIDSGENGYLVEPRDWKALGEHLAELSLNKEKRERMGALIKEKAESEFSLKHMCHTQLNIYKTILNTEKKLKADGKKYDVAILGYYGYKNSGDEAILRSTLNAFRKLDPDLSYIVFSRDPKETKKHYQVDSFNRFNLLKVRKILKSTRLFLAGGGSLIQDNTSTRSILYYLTVLRMAKMCGTRAMLFANGIGPIKKAFNRRNATRVLDHLYAISLRDSESFQEIKSLGISKPHIYVTSDPAILLKPAADERIRKLMDKEGVPHDKPLVGFSIRKWADSSYLEDIAAIADFCSEKLGAYVVFIPMQFPSDYEICSEVKNRMKHPATIIKNMYCPEDMLGFVGKLELLVGMRLHSLIYAASQCVPLTGLVYEPKVDAFLNEIGQPSAGSIEKLDKDKVRAIIEELWNSKADIKERLQKSKERLALMAQINVDTAYQTLKGNDSGLFRNSEREDSALARPWLRSVANRYG
ncbi:MAG: polysaccharide pyruvyl transferase CsaB [Clostridia bacterium]|nr:polysaccharide pyruvyl transferase CsaB [Clostridia bacterium]